MEEQVLPCWEKAECQSTLWLLEKITPGLMLLAEAQNEVSELFLCHFWPAPKPIDAWNTFKEEIIRVVVLSCYVPVLKFP